MAADKDTKDNTKPAAKEGGVDDVGKETLEREAALEELYKDNPDATSEDVFTEQANAAVNEQVTQLPGSEPEPEAESKDRG